jgi:DNA-binding beta-propeller fold protein YncE
MDVATRKIIKELPSGKDPEQFALHPNDRWLYVSNEDDALVTVIDTDLQGARADRSRHRTRRHGGQP